MICATEYLGGIEINIWILDPAFLAARKNVKHLAQMPLYLAE
jgi:hypothetical protein